MGLVHAKVTLANPRKPDIDPIEIESLADTGALHLCLPAALVERLGLEELHKRRVMLADGQRKECPYVGPVHVSVGDRACYTGAIVMGDEPLLGAVPMEDMDLWISPARHELVPNPASPDMPMSVAKGLRRLRP